MGYEENYQPNYGYWDLESNGNTMTLIHNKLMIYEKRYEIITLTEDSLVRKLIGPRVVYYFNENANDAAVFTAHTWIEVFISRVE